MLFGRTQAPRSQLNQVQRLVTAIGLVGLSEEDAGIIARYMHLRRVPGGTLLLQAGEVPDEHRVALIIQGCVRVEGSSVDRTVVSLLERGELLGEMSLIDGGAASATCTAEADSLLAELSGAGLARMMERHPAIAARLLQALAQRVIRNLRETNRKLLTLIRVGRAQQEELDAVQATNRRLLRRAVGPRSKTTRARPAPPTRLSDPRAGAARGEASAL